MCVEVDEAYQQRDVTMHIPESIALRLEELAKQNDVDISDLLRAILMRSGGRPWPTWLATPKPRD